MYEVIPMDDTNKYLTQQIITYLGNKRSLLDFIGVPVKMIQEDLNKTNISTLDLFSGSGIVARYFKTFASKVYANDLEGYSNRINKCYLINKSEYDKNKLNEYYNLILTKLENEGFKSGFIAEMYSPKDDENIQLGERVFYTTRNAKFIDTVRCILDDIPEPYQTLLIAPLMYEASVKNNTSGVFKGFYKNSETNIGQFGGNGKNALQRILADIELKLPVLYERECEYEVFQENANDLVKKLPHVDLAYLDPPYNQHPYSSNYFMLNLINTYKKPDNVSAVAGIPTDWNKSNYNKKALALSSMEDLCSNINATYILISFNSDGFISRKEMVEMLSKFGEVQVFTKEYNTFRASRNLSERDIHVNEYLYLLKKEVK
jgi:adenine-specific DNA-methyltransferase